MEKMNSKQSKLNDDSTAVQKSAELKPPKHVSGVLQLIYYPLAFVFFLFGVLGVILPGIPATPFFLLMSYFLIRVSPKLHARAMRVPMIGKPLRDWEEKGGVRLGVKFLAYAMVFLFVGYSLIFSNFSLAIRISIGALALVGLGVVYKLPTVRD